MKVDTTKTDARAAQARQQGRNEAANEDKARRFQKQLLRRRQEEEGARSETRIVAART